MSDETAEDYDLSDAYADDDLVGLLTSELPNGKFIERESEFADLIKEHVSEAEKHLVKAKRIRRAEVAQQYAEERDTDD
jgi:hypothetical protein